jgi:MFS family permease
MKGGRVKMTEKWWRKKWYWLLCILLPLALILVINHFFFPETPLSRSVVYAVAGSIGVLLAYFAYRGKSIFKIQPKTLRRIIFIAFGAFCVGSLLWAFLILPLASYYTIPGPIVILLLFVLMIVCALIVDTIMKRRDYRPFIEGGGNI